MTTPTIDEMVSDATLLRLAATKLSERIDRFEAWINTLPVKTAVETTVDDDAGGDGRLIRIDRDRKTWVVDVARIGHFEWVRLRLASLDVKADFVCMFPKLIEALHGKQRRLLARIEAANVAFDALADQYAIPAKPLDILNVLNGTDE